MDPRFHRIEARGVAVVLDLLIGHVRSFEVDAGGRILTLSTWFPGSTKSSKTRRCRRESGFFPAIFSGRFSENDVAGAYRPIRNGGRSERLKETGSRHNRAL